MAKFRYPTDTDQFPEIIEKGMVYVDKTDLMYSLVDNYKYVFLARPRRFGKSLLCTTLKAYFEGRKELFEGLKVMEFEKEWKKHPVLHFDMSVLKNQSIADAKTNLERLISLHEKKYGRNPEDITPGARLSGLIHNAAEQTGEDVVVILDEYDSPIMRILYEKEQLKAMRTMLREFYQVLKSEGANLRFVFLTGVTKFSQLSIFSELNNLNQISMLDEYSGICGITQEELDTSLRPCVEEYARNRKITTEEAYSQLKNNYDGYHFSPGGKDVYAPFSLLRALSQNSTDHFWFESGTSASLLEHLEHFRSEKEVLNYDGMKVRESDFSLPCEDAPSPLPLLYQTGYLTIASHNPAVGSYVLKIPNNEVRTGLIQCLMPLILHRKTTDNSSLLNEMAESILDRNLGSALMALRSYIAGIPYDIITKDEWEKKGGYESFYQLLIYMAFSMLNSVVDAEVKSILGRADVIIKTTQDIFIIELKVNKTARAALKQVNDMGYATPYEADHRRIVKCGVSISSEMRNIAQWIITDAQGNKIESKDFKKRAGRKRRATPKKEEK